MSNDSVTSSQLEAAQYLEQAYASKEQNEFEKVLEQCNAAIRADPNLADAYNLRGVILEELGRKEEAVLAYREAVRADSGFQEARENLRDIEAELKENEFRSLQIEGKGFGIRAVAYVIDSIVMYASNYVAGTLGGLTLGMVLGIVFTLTGRDFYINEESLQCLVSIGGLVLSVLYFATFEWLYGATFGKLVLGLRVVKENGGPCDLKASFIRALYRFIDGLLFGILAYTSMNSSLLKQRIGDKKAQTIVVGSKDPIIQQPRAWWWFLVAVVLYLPLAVIMAILLISTALR